MTATDSTPPGAAADDSGLPLVVVGSGILGVSTAHHLARAGQRVVLVSDGPLTTSSGRSLSWLNSAGFRVEPYHRLRMAGLDRYRTMAARLPGAEWLRFDAGLRWSTEDGADGLLDQGRYELELGYDSRLVDATSVGGLDPAVNVDRIGAAAAVWNAGEGWVDLPSQIGRLAEEIRRLGGMILDVAGRAGVELADGRVAGVRLGNGRVVAARAAPLATGSATPGMLSELGVHIPTPPRWPCSCAPHRSPLGCARCSIRLGWRSARRRVGRWPWMPTRRQRPSSSATTAR